MQAELYQFSTASKQNTSFVVKIVVNIKKEKSICLTHNMKPLSS